MRGEVCGDIYIFCPPSLQQSGGSGPSPAGSGRTPGHSRDGKILKKQIFPSLSPAPSRSDDEGGGQRSLSISPDVVL